MRDLCSFRSSVVFLCISVFFGIMVHIVDRLPIRRQIGICFLWLRKKPLPKSATERTFFKRALDAIENPYFINPAMLVLGLIGMFLLAPILVLFGVCVLLSIHRSEAVADKSHGVQILTYSIVSLVTMIGLFTLGIYIKNRVPHFATREEVMALFHGSGKDKPDTAVVGAPNSPSPESPTTKPLPKAFLSRKELRQDDHIEIGRLRDEVMDLINPMYSDTQDTFKTDERWRAHTPSNGVNAMRHANYDQFTILYNQKYRCRAVSIYKKLMGHISHVPPQVGSYNRTELYGPNKTNLPSFTSHLAREQSIDLCVLLNQAEVENGARPTCPVEEIKQRLGSQ
jgi:hypothetical protein